MLRYWHREWLALTTVLVVTGACELNPQPDLPANDGRGSVSGGSGGSLSIDMGGTSAEPGSGAIDSGGSDSKGGSPAQVPEVSGGQSADAGAGGQSAGGDGGGQAGDSTAGQAGASGGDTP